MGGGTIKYKHSDVLKVKAGPGKGTVIGRKRMVSFIQGPSTSGLLVIIALFIACVLQRSEETLIVRQGSLAQPRN